MRGLTATEQAYFEHMKELGFATATILSAIDHNRKKDEPTVRAVSAQRSGAKNHRHRKREAAAADERRFGADYATLVDKKLEAQKRSHYTENLQPNSDRFAFVPVSRSTLVKDWARGLQGSLGVLNALVNSDNIVIREKMRQNWVRGQIPSFLLRLGINFVTIEHFVILDCSMPWMFSIHEVFDNVDKDLAAKYGARAMYDVGTFLADVLRRQVGSKKTYPELLARYPC